MATPADQRLLELLDKWLKSLELHIRYSTLDSDSYSKIQPWPEHQRPSRWIIDLALQKALALRSQVHERVKTGDTRFSDSLELMTFLANLIGSEHIERFIPLAAAENERILPLAPPDAPPLPPLPPLPPVAATGTREMPEFVAAKGRAPPPDAATGTREMPEFVAAKPHAPPPVATEHVARTERKPGNPKPAPRASPKQQPGRLSAPARAVSTAKPTAKVSPAAEEYDEPGEASAAVVAREQVIADAARLVQWGRKWFELAELIARMADRPPLPEVRRILKDNKTAIEKKAGAG